MESAKQFKKPAETGLRRGKYPVSINKISAKTGLRRGHISKILNGRRARMDTIIRIAGAMGISLDAFYHFYYKKPDKVA